MTMIIYQHPSTTTIWSFGMNHSIINFLIHENLHPDILPPSTSPHVNMVSFNMTVIYISIQKCPLVSRL